MTNTDDLNTDLDQACLDAIRDFFNAEAEPGTQIHKMQVAVAKGLIAAGPFDIADKAALLDKRRGGA